MFPFFAIYVQFLFLNKLLICSHLKSAENYDHKEDVKPKTQVAR